MKLMFLAPHLGLGGAERVLSSLSLRLAEDIEQVLVLFEDRVDYPHRARLVSLDSPSGSLSPPARALRFGQRLARLKAVIAQERPDRVVSFMGESNVLNALLGTRPVLTVHSHLAKEHRRLSGRLLRRLIPWVFRRGSVVAVSEGIRAELIGEFGLDPARVEAIPNPVDIEAISRCLDGEPLPAPPKPQLMACGCLTPAKDHALLLRAFARLRRRHDCRLLIVGQGPLRPRLEAQAQELGIADDVTFAGAAPNPFRQMALSSVFVMSSAWEGFGIVLVEAMACGVPVVSTDCRYGPREILAPGTGSEPRTDGVEWGPFGALTAPGSEEALADALGELLGDPEKRRAYAEAGLRRARDFEASRITTRYEALLAA